jgi:hypothetical protein
VRYLESSLPAGLGIPLDPARVSFWITDFQETEREDHGEYDGSPVRSALSASEGERSTGALWRRFVDRILEELDPAEKPAVLAGFSVREGVWREVLEGFGSLEWTYRIRGKRGGVDPEPAVLLAVTSPFIRGRGLRRCP